MFVLPAIIKCGDKMKLSQNEEGAVLILALILLAVSVTLITAVNTLIYNSSNQMENKSELKQLDELVNAGLQEEHERLKKGVIAPGEDTQSLSVGQYTTDVTFLEDDYAKIESTAKIEGQTETSSITKKLRHTTKDYSVFNLDTMMNFYGDGDNDGTGDDYIDVSSIPDVKNNFTIEFWAKPEREIDIYAQSNLGNQGTYFPKNLIIREKHRGEDANYENNKSSGVGVSFGTNGLMVIEHSSNFYNFPLTWEDTSGLIDGLTHVAIVYDDLTPSLYINGQYIKTGLTSGKEEIYGTDANVYAGLSQGDIGRGLYGDYRGGLQELRFWDDVRTETEIQNNWQQDLTGDEANLVAYYKFNNLSHARLLKDYAHGNDGIIYGPTIGQELIRTLKFNGDDSHALLDSLTYDSAENDELTIMTRLKTTKVNGVIYSFDDERYFELRLNQGKLQFDYNSRQVENVSEQTINDGRMHIIAVTFEQGNVKFYIDGQLSGEYNLSSDYELIRARHSGKVLTVEDGDTADRTRIVQYTYQAQDYQQWEILDVYGGYYKLTPRHSSKVLTAVGHDSQTELSNDSNAIAQHWILDLQTIRNSYDTIMTRKEYSYTYWWGGFIPIPISERLALDVRDIDETNNAEVIIYQQNNQSNQQWQLEPIDKYFGSHEQQQGYIGVDADSEGIGSNYFQGEIEWLQHWDRALSQDKIKEYSKKIEQYYDNPEQYSDSKIEFNQKAFYSAYHQNTGQPLEDGSTNNYDGAMNNIEVFQKRSSYLELDEANNDYLAISNQNYQGSDYQGLTLIAKIETTDDHGIIYSFDRSEYFRLGLSASGDYDGSGGSETPEPGKLTFEFSTSNGVKDLIWDLNDTKINDDKKHVIAITFGEDSTNLDQGVVKMYIDGQEHEIKTYQGQPFPAEFGSGVQRYGFIGVGSEATSFNGNRGPNEYFDGRLYWLQHWSRVLTQSEIENYSEGVLNNNNPDLVSFYYPLPEGIIPDLSASFLAEEDYFGEVNGEPKYSIAGIWKDKNSDSNSLVATTDNSQAVGAKVLRASNEISYYKDKFYNYDSSKIYKIEAKVRQLLPASNSEQKCSIGIESFSGLEYMIVEDVQLTTDEGWQVLTGYFSANSNAGVKFGLTNIDGIAQFRPIIKLNVDTGDGLAEVDFLRIKELQVQN